MWIWELPKSEGGDVAAIAARAHAAGMSTVFVKSSDGADEPLGAVQRRRSSRRCTPTACASCAWQFVYGNDPLGEAALGADAVAAGADCLVIDAETQYEGKYAAGAAVHGARCARRSGRPTRSASRRFPYVDYHPRLPYSVFLGPGGAQANLPQVYWKDIGGTVDAVSGHTLAHNRIYGVADRAARPDLRQPAAGGHRALPLAVGRLRQRGPVVVVLAGDRRGRRGRALAAAGPPLPAPAAGPGLAARWPRATRATRSSGCSSTSPPPTRP